MPIDHVRQSLSQFVRRRVAVLSIAALVLAAVTLTASQPQTASASAPAVAQVYTTYPSASVCNYGYNTAYYSYPWSYICGTGYNAYTYPYSGYSTFNYPYVNPYSAYQANFYYPWYGYNQWWPYWR